MKIDVEGFESEVIEGASLLIKKCKPNLIKDTYHHANDALKIFDEVLNIHEYQNMGSRMSQFYLTFFISQTPKNYHK
jgi:hypothetical protein